MQLKKLNHIHDLTESFGLTLNESEVYVFLLQAGQSVGSQIYKGLGLDKSSCYRALHGLIAKNLVYKIGEERNALFGARPHKQILALADKKIKAVVDNRAQLQEWLSSLERYAKEQYQANVTIFEGKDGYKKFIESRLIPNTTIREIGSRDTVVNYFDSVSEYEMYMQQEYVPKRIENKVFLKGLMPQDDKRDVIERSSRKRLKEVHVLPEGFLVPALLTTWEDFTGFYSQESGTIICVRIKDKLLSTLFNQMFDFMFVQLPNSGVVET